MATPGNHLITKLSNENVKKCKLSDIVHLGPWVTNQISKILWYVVMVSWDISLHTSQVAHQTGAYPFFCRMRSNRLRIFLYPLGWDTSPLQGSPSITFAGTHLDTLVPGGERQCESKVSCSRTQNNVPGQGSNPLRSIRRRAHSHTSL